MQYSIILSGSHATQAFTQLEQGQDESLDKYLYQASELLSKIYHTPDISAEDLNHYAVVYGLKLQEVKRQHHRTPEHAMQNYGRVVQRYSVLGMNDLRAIPEPNSIPQINYVFLRSKS